MLPFTAKELTAAFDDAFDSRTIKKGEAYFRRGQVLHRELTPEDDGWMVSAKVRGSDFEPYEVNVFIAREPYGVSIESACSCPVMIDCKHCAATVLAIINEAHDPKITEQQLPFEKNIKAMPSPAEAALPSDWNQWLQRIESAAVAPKAPAPNDYPPEEWHRLLYILKPVPTGRRIQIEFASARLLKTGGYGQPQNYHFSNIINRAHQRPAFIRPGDEVLARKIAMVQEYLNAFQPELQGASGAELLPEILATGRCKWRGSGQKHPVLSLGEKRTAKAAWKMDDKGAQFPSFEVIPPVTDILPLSPLWYVDEATATCGPLETDLPQPIAEAWLSAPKLLPEQATLLEKELPKHRTALELPAPRRVEIELIKNVKPTVCLHLYSVETKRDFHFYYSAREQQRTRINLAHLEFDYGGRRFSYDHGASAEHFSDGKLVRLERHRKAEQIAFLQLMNAGLSAAEPIFFNYNLGKSKDDLTFHQNAQWLRFVMESVPELRSSGWNIEFDPTFEFRVAEAEDWYADAENNGIDWFGVEVGVQVDGERINLLPLLLDQLQKQPRMLESEMLAKMSNKQFIPIHLPDGRVLPFPAKRVKEMLGVLLELFDADSLDRNGRLKLSRLRAAELSSIAGETNWSWRGSKELKQLSDNLRNFKGIQSVAPSKALKAELRPYQQEGLNWLQFLREYQLGGILADDMGLGKTVQTLSHLLHEKESGRADRPSLVIAPTSLMTNWRQETERFAPDLKLLVLHGLDRKRHFDKLRNYDVVVTSYPLLPKDEAILLKEKFHYIVLDEAQFIKNAKTKYAQIACQLKARHHLCLTGTPMENHLGELWSQFNFLLPGFLGDEVRFRKLFRNPIERGANEERRRLLAQRVAPFILRRRKEDVAKELPPKTEIVQNVELTGAQRDLYETIRLAMHAKVREEVAKKGMSRSHIIILEALLKLRQVCCDPRLVKLDSARKVQESAKLELLMDLLPEMLKEGRRILLFSQFTSMLELIEAELQKMKVEYALLTGQTTDRATPIESFQSGKVPLFLISLKAGGTGLNLTAADTVIHYDPWWNPAVENQATDRAHRIGQTKSVFVYKLMTVGTVEERILELQKRKRELVEGLFDEKRKESLKLSAEDLDVLFAPLE